MSFHEIILCGAAVLCAFGIAFLFTPFAKKFAFRVGAMDIPRDSRRMHKRPTPRLGGTAVALAFFLGCALFSVQGALLQALIPGGIGLCILGMADDIRPLSAPLKLAGQCICAFLGVKGGACMQHLSFLSQTLELGKWGAVLSFLWILSLINAINLIDGLDGLCGGVCSIASLTLLLITVSLCDVSAALPCALLLGAVLGFLPYNRHPAGIFIGDTGAMFLGYTLAVLSLEGLFQSQLLTALSVAILLFAFPLLDTALAFLRRLLHAQNPFRADCRHLHHRLIAQGYTQSQAVKVLCLLCAIGAVVALTLTKREFRAVGVMAIAVLWCAFCRIYFRAPQKGRCADALKRTDRMLQEKQGK